MKPQHSRNSLALLLAGIAWLLSACQSTRTTPIDEPSVHEGLQRVEVRGIDAVYRRPDADLSRYTKVLVPPPDVQFSKNWKPEQSSALHGMTRIDRDKIRQDLATLFIETFQRELQTKGSYQLVQEPAPDVLEVRSAITNLYISAPDVSAQTAARVRTYTTDAGEMTLIAELHDSVSGTLLSRVYDQRDAMGTGTWQWTTSITNAADARNIIASWAATLRRALDAARGSSTSQ